MNANTPEEKVEFYRNFFSSREHFESAREDLNNFKASSSKQDKNDYPCDESNKPDSGTFFR